MLLSNCFSLSHLIWCYSYAYWSKWEIVVSLNGSWRECKSLKKNWCFLIVGSNRMLALISWEGLSKLDTSCPSRLICENGAQFKKLPSELQPDVFLHSFHPQDSRPVSATLTDRPLCPSQWHPRGPASLPVAPPPP